jgi:predicted nucleic acid-binding protein
MTFEQAYELQREAESLLSGNEYEVDSLDVLTLVRDSECSAYYGEFVALAKRLGVNLITMDKIVLRE